MMKPFIVLLAAFFVFNIAAAQQQQHYSRAKIALDGSGHTMQELAALGIAVDHGEYKKNTFFVSDFSDHELADARKAGFTVQIIIDDVAKHYREQNKKKAEKRTTSISCDPTPVTDPAHFHLGSYAGGYFSYTEMLRILDSMQLLYPGLISVRQPIDTFHTIEGRPIYWLRVSNNPGADQPAKPQMLYNAVHHAREPGSLASTIYYLWYLLENYSTDPHIKALIDNTELYFVPCVNPDGYIYNITTDPTGGGLWRKNRRNNGDGTFGVDLNRNYGYDWGYDNIGSSPSTTSDTYRGTAAFSEPETRAIKWMCDNHHFKIALNYHSYHNDILYPWGFTPAGQTVDSNIFFNHGEYLTRHNRYRYGNSFQTLNYVTNGDSDDWMYGDVTTKGKIFAYTPEIGATMFGFYPPTTQILPDCRNNLLSNINCASLLLPFADVRSTDFKILTKASGYLHFDLERLGFPDTATFTLSILPLDTFLTAATTPKVYTGLSMLQQVSDSISYSLSPATANGQMVSYVLQVNNGFYYIYDTVYFYFGRQYNISNRSTASLADWTTSSWGLCTASYYAPPASIKSSLACTDNYPNNVDVAVTTTVPVDLTYSTRAYLDFYTKWSIETEYDYVFVNSSVHGSGVWQPLCGRFTTADKRYDGQQPNWVMEEMDLGDFLGKKVDIQFELTTDNAVSYNGFYFNNPVVTAIQDTPAAVQTYTGKSASILLSPNPAHDILNITVSGLPSFPLQATLIDCLGRSVMNFEISNRVSAVNVRQLPFGTYYLRIIAPGASLPVQHVQIGR